MPYATVEIDYSNESPRLILSTNGQPVALSDEQIGIKNRLMEYNNIVSNYLADVDRTGLYLRILEIGKSALTSEKIDRDHEEHQLKQLATEIVNASLVVRESYIKSIMKASLFVLYLGIVFVVVWGGFVGSDFQEYILVQVTLATEVIDTFISIIGGIGFSMIGLYLGINLKPLLSNRIMDLHQVSRLMRYRFSNALYLAYLVILLIVLILLLSFDVVQIGIANILLNDMQELPWIGIFSGLVCAFAEPKIAELLRTVVSAERRESGVG